MLNLESVGGKYAEAQEVVITGQVHDLDIVRPRFDDFKREAAQIAQDAKALEVWDDESLTLAVSIGGSAKRIAAKIEVQREAIIAEPREFISGVNGLCNMITDLLVVKKNSKKEITNPDCAENLLKNRILQHQARIELDRRKQEEAARRAAVELQAKLQAEADELNRKAREEAARIAEEEARKRRASVREIEEARAAAEAEARRHEIAAPVVIAPVMPEAQRVVRTESGSASQRKVWSFEILDIALVPKDFMVVDEQKIRDFIRMGGREILGVRIFEEIKTVFRS